MNDSAMFDFIFNMCAHAEGGKALPKVIGAYYADVSSVSVEDVEGRRAVTIDCINPADETDESIVFYQDVQLSKYRILRISLEDLSPTLDGIIHWDSPLGECAEVLGEYDNLTDLLVDLKAAITCVPLDIYRKVEDLSRIERQIYELLVRKASAITTAEIAYRIDASDSLLAELPTILKGMHDRKVLIGYGGHANRHTVYTFSNADLEPENG